MNKTSIGWTDFTANPVKYRDKTGKVVWACVRHSPGCTNCYAQSLAHRYGKGKEFTATNLEGVTPFLDLEELKKLATTKTIAGKRVFIEDMSDLFGSWIPDDMIDAVFSVMIERADVTFQVLTKRAARMAGYVARLAKSIVPLEKEARLMGRTFMFRGLDDREYSLLPPPPWKHIYLGFSAENQEWFDKRAAQVSPLIREGWNVWTSFEPLLGAIKVYAGAGLKWAVVGGESGRGHRPCETEWIAALAEQFTAAGVPIFVKQASGHIPGKQGRIPLDVWNLKQLPPPHGVPSQVATVPRDWNRRKGV